MPDLYACGFNAHGQLTFDSPDQPHPDIHQFAKVLSGTSIEILYSGWSQTIARVDGRLLCGGYCQVKAKRHRIICDAEILPEDITSFVGDIYGVRAALTKHGCLISVVESEEGLKLQRFLSSSHGDRYICYIAIAGNEKVAVVLRYKSNTSERSEVLYQFPSWVSFQDWHGASREQDPERLAEPLLSLDRNESVKQLVANENSFTLLYEDGRVFTWGDPRHNHLGRRPDEETSPSWKPSIVDAIGGIHIKKLAAGGWTTTALSESDDVYYWGDLMDPNGERVTLLEVANQADIIDVAVGGGHMLVLTRDQGIWAKGRGDNGQLGMNTEATGAWVHPRGMEIADITHLFATTNITFALSHTTQDGKGHAATTTR